MVLRVACCLGLGWHCLVSITGCESTVEHVVQYSIATHCLHFSGHFPGGTGLAGTRMFPFWILVELRMLDVLVTTGAVRCAKLQSNRLRQQTTTPSVCCIIDVMYRWCVCVVLCVGCIHRPQLMMSRTRHSSSRWCRQQRSSQHRRRRRHTPTSQRWTPF